MSGDELVTNIMLNTISNGIIKHKMMTRGILSISCNLLNPARIQHPIDYGKSERSKAAEADKTKTTEQLDNIEAEAVNAKFLENIEHSLRDLERDFEGLTVPLVGIFAVLHKDENHWISLFWDKRTNNFTVMDTLWGDDTLANIRSITPMVTYMYNLIERCSFFTPYTTPFTIDYQKKLRQRGDNSCGFWVMLVAHCFAFNRSLDMEAINRIGVTTYADNLRVYFTCELLSYIYRKRPDPAKGGGRLPTRRPKKKAAVPKKKQAASPEPSACSVM